MQVAASRLRPLQAESSVRIFSIGLFRKNPRRKIELFADKVRIFIKSGDGGNGAVSFHTEKYVPNGGPGRRRRRQGRRRGFSGEFKRKHAERILLQKTLPRAERRKRRGGRTAMASRGRTLKFSCPWARLCATGKRAESWRICSRTDRLSSLCAGAKAAGETENLRQAAVRLRHLITQGGKTEKRKSSWSLKPLPTRGTGGFPNVGKSTLLSVISAARPKIANYHFTTLNPNLGVVNVFEDSFVVADIPD